MYSINKLMNYFYDKIRSMRTPFIQEYTYCLQVRLNKIFFIIVPLLTLSQDLNRQFVMMN